MNIRQLPRAVYLFGATVFAATGLCAATGLASQGDIWTDAEVKRYFRTTWDWRTTDPTNFPTFYGTPSILPWTPDAAAGVHVAGNDVPQPTDGWRLYDKHLDCTDYGMPPNCLDLVEPGSGAILSVLPHFSFVGADDVALREHAVEKRPSFYGRITTADYNDGHGDLALWLFQGEGRRTWLTIR